jgi:hypothetical protein
MKYLGNHGYEWSHWVPNRMVNTPNGQPVFEPIDLTVFDPSSDCWLGICQFFKWSFHNIHIFVRRQSCLCKWVRCSFVVIGSLFLVGCMYVYIYTYIHTYIDPSYYCWQNPFSLPVFSLNQQDFPLSLEVKLMVSLLKLFLKPNHWYLLVHPTW